MTTKVASGDVSMRGSSSSSRIFVRKSELTPVIFNTSDISSSVGETISIQQSSVASSMRAIFSVSGSVL